MRITIYAFFYRNLMRLSHRFNWHHTRTCYPDGDTLKVCDWCGLSCVTHRSYSGYKPISSGGPDQCAAVDSGSLKK